MYSSLNDMLQQDAEAVEYFSNLPDDIKEQISQKAHDVRSLKGLQDYVSRLKSK